MIQKLNISGRFKTIKKSASAITIILMAIVVLCSFNFFKGWKGDTSPFRHDAEQYHSYLVAQFIHHDMTFSWPNGYWIHKSPKDIYVNKFTLGVALLETPFFLIGHKIAQITDHKVDGYSSPYSYSVSFGILFYVFIGLCLVRKVLLDYYDEMVTSLTLFSVFLGTNLHYYSISEGPMSHSYLFFLTSLILYFAWKWDKTNKLKYFYASFFFCGFAAVLRPTNAVCMMIPVLFGITNFRELWARIKVVFETKTVVNSTLFFILAASPQLIYWKWATGTFIYYSYTKEGFFFDDPKIIPFLFSFTKGWFIYTPIMLLGCMGIFLPSAKQVRLLNIIFFSVIIYVLSSWWCWWYGGSYGMRAMVEYYLLLALPLAAFFKFVTSTNIKKAITISFTVMLVSWNIIGEVRYRTGVICWDGMTFESYKMGIFHYQFNEEERKEFKNKLYFIDAEGALEGNRD